MKNRSMTVTLSADREVVFAFLSQLENLPRWAPRFCRGLRRGAAGWRAQTPGGECCVALVADARTGVIDLFVGEQPDEMALLPLRVVGRPHGSAVLGTVSQPPAWGDELYELNYDALLADWRGLAGRFGGGAVEGPGAGAEPFYPGLVTARFFETWDFYAGRLGFRTLFESDAYVHLVHPSGAQLGVLRHETDGTAAELVSATDGRGFWLSLDVADADAEHERLRAAGVEIAEEIEDKPWGDRQFMVRDPNGVLIAIAHRRAASRPEAALATAQ